MCASGWPITLLLLCMCSSATSSPVSIHTPAPPLPSQISPPSPTIPPPPPSPSLSVPPPVHNAADSREKAGCSLTTSPSALVVRFGDPVTVNCSVQRMAHFLLGWEVSPEDNVHTTENFLTWNVTRMNTWTIKPSCYALSDIGGKCDISLPVTVYKPPDNVSLSFVNHTGPMFEGCQYTLQCLVEDVAPVENLTVTFYRGQTALGQLHSNNYGAKEPVNESFTLNISPSREDDGVQYWCEAKLNLGPEGPRHPPVVMSQKHTAVVLFGPHLVCPAKLQVREGESILCEVRGNPQPQVTWFRDGQVVALPAHSSKQHAGTYTILTKGHRGQKNFTVEVEVLTGSGTANYYNRHFLLAVLLVQMISWL